MKQLIAISAFVLFTVFSLFAQKSTLPPVTKGQTKNIIIRKKGGDKEKTTIVIEGDKITVNGKPLEDYKGDIQISENSNSDFDAMPALPPVPPVYTHGGAKSFSQNFSYGNNSAFLGVSAENDEAGVKIRAITKGSPAEKAGLKQGDIITKIGTDKVNDADDLVEAVGNHKPDDKVTVTYLRDKKENNVTATLSKNEQTGFAWSGDNRDLLKTFKNYSRNWNDDKPRLGLRVEDTETDEGVKVTDIDDEDAPAAKAGLKEGDIITKINGIKITFVKEAKDALKDLKPGDNVSVLYLREGSSQTATVHVPKQLESSDL